MLEDMADTLNDINSQGNDIKDLLSDILDILQDIRDKMAEVQNANQNQLQRMGRHTRMVAREIRGGLHIRNGRPMQVSRYILHGRINDRNKRAKNGAPKVPKGSQGKG